MSAATAGLFGQLQEFLPVHCIVPIRVGPFQDPSHRPWQFVTTYLSVIVDVVSHNMTHPFLSIAASPTATQSAGTTLATAGTLMRWAKFACAECAILVQA